MTTAGYRAPRQDLALLGHQIRYEQLSFWRNPQSAFFTFVFPVVLIAIFGALFRSGGSSSYFYGLTALQYYVPTIAALSVLGSCYSQLSALREGKHVRTRAVSPLNRPKNASSPILRISKAVLT